MKPGRPAKPKSDHRQTITIRLSPETMKIVKNLSRNVKGAWIEEAIIEKSEKENPRNNG